MASLPQLQRLDYIEEQLLHVTVQQHRLFSFSTFPRQPYLVPAGTWSASPFRQRSGCGGNDAGFRGGQSLASVPETVEGALAGGRRVGAQTQQASRSTAICQVDLPVARPSIAKETARRRPLQVPISVYPGTSLRVSPDFSDVAVGATGSLFATCTNRGGLTASAMSCSCVREKRLGRGRLGPEYGLRRVGGAGSRGSRGSG